MEWSPWGHCSRTCDGGERIRYRICQNDTNKCKQELTCKGSNKQIEPCNTEKCRKWKKNNEVFVVSPLYERKNDLNSSEWN